MPNWINGVDIDGGTAFVPSAITGLVLDLDPSAIVGKNDGDTVAAADFVDQSGLGNTPSFAVGGLYKTNIANGRPAVRLNGTTQYYRITRNAGLEPTAITIFTVVRSAVTPVDFAYVISKPKDSGTADSAGIQNRTGSGVHSVGKVATTGVVLSPFVQLADIWDGDSKIITMRLDGTDSRIYLNGGLIGTPPAAVGAIQYDATDWYIGSFDGTLPFGGDILRILMYNSALSDTNRWKVHNYLGTRFAI